MESKHYTFKYKCVWFLFVQHLYRVNYIDYTTTMGKRPGTDHQTLFQHVTCPLIKRRGGKRFDFVKSKINGLTTQEFNPRSLSQVSEKLYQ